MERRLSADSVAALTGHGLTDAEIFGLVIPKRTLSHRRQNHTPLSVDESDKAVRLARLSALAEEVFGDDTKAGLWLRSPKRRFEGRTPLQLLATEIGGRLVEEALLQLDEGFFA